MPIYMDCHILPGVKARDVAEAHRRDLLIQDDHRCNCMTYWIDEKRGNVFCLIEAPTAEAVVEMHSKAHGLVPHKIIEVNGNVVESFLGRITDPEDAESAEGLKIFSDSSYRTLLYIQIPDPVLLQNQIGSEKAKEFFKQQNEIIRNEISSFEGSEIEHQGNSFIASFKSTTKAYACALSLREKLANSNSEQGMAVRMGIHAGDPIEKKEKLFGDILQMAERMCALAKDFQIAMSSVVRDVLSKDIGNKEGKHILAMTPQDEISLEALYDTLEKHYHDPDFNAMDFAQAMAMSKSQLYRKTVSLTGFSPNSLIKEFRLEKARELMRKKPSNISQITFDAGFSSPSYFTKCFKKKYGILPMTYVDVLG